MKLMLDTNIFDKLSINASDALLLKQLSLSRQLEVFITSVQINQINQITDDNKRNRLLALLSDVAPTKLIVEYAPYGYSYGERYGQPTSDVILDRDKFITSQSHIEDAIIAATASSAKYNLDFVVTDDIKFRKKLNAQSIGTKAINYKELVYKINSMAT